MEHPETYISQRIAVPVAFEEVFSHFYLAQNKSSQVITKTLLPSYQTILVFSFGPPVSLLSGNNTIPAIEKCLVLGPIKKAFEYSLPPQAEILVANFKEDAFYRFFGSTPVAEQLPFNPDDLLEENCFTALWAALSHINSTDNRILYILDFCQPYLRERSAIASLLTGIKEENINPIKSVAGNSQQSERTVQLAHKKQLGYSAKELGRYQRFLKAVKLVQDLAGRDQKMDWFEVISECGYYDQSQLIHDFKHYTQLSPSHYLRFQQDICNPAP